MNTSGNDAITLTGCGWVTPFAAGTIDEVLAAALQFSPSPPQNKGLWAVPNEQCIDPSKVSNEIKRDKGAWITASALEHACRCAGLNLEEEESERVSLVLGSAFAGQLGMIRFADEVRAQSARFVSPIHFPQTVGNYVAGAIARAYGIKGPNSTVATGAASGLDAIVEAKGILNTGMADIVIAGGMDTLSDDLAIGLAEPGVCLSEGACLFVLERADHAERRGVRPLASLDAGPSPGSPTALPTGANGVILSTVLRRCPGAVFMEHWVGRCFGCLGAAAVAGAIGAGSGASVPFADPDRGETTCVRPVSADRLPSANAPLRAVVTADADGSGIRQVRVDLVFPAPD